MVASRLVSRRATVADNRLIAATALTALAALLLMLVAGAAKAEDISYVCWDASGGRLECETLQSVETTCAAIAGRHELCRAVSAAQANGGAMFYPANTKYTTVKLMRASLAAWHRYKSH
jgi:hypothetical protein